MSRRVYQQLVAERLEPGVQERTILYLTEHLGGFLKRGERVLICFGEHEKGNISWLMQQAVLRCSAIPVVWGPDRRWKTLLRQAFDNRASVIIGAPLLVLGLTKVMKACATPLYIRKVITAGYPCLDWMIEGIAKGFDCVVGGCFGLGITGVVAGFACGHSWGVHLREAEYGVKIVDQQGACVPDGQQGQIVLYSRHRPMQQFPTGEYARLETSPCPCGCPAPRLMDFMPVDVNEPELLALGQQLLRWTSVLDCSLRRSSYGLEMELLAFQGEKLPKLPTAAKLKIRHLDLEVDEPFPYDPSMKNPVLLRENH